MHRLPVRVGGAIVGAIGVSGAANHEQDEAVAKAGAAALKEPPHAATRRTRCARRCSHSSHSQGSPSS